MPKQPLRTNQIVSKLKAASSPVIYGTATNAIDALQLSLDSPTALGDAWYCRVGEEWKPMPVIDLGSNKYMAIEFSQTFGYIAAYYAEGQIRGTSEKKLAGIEFVFLSKEDCNDTATQLINAGESKEIVNPNPSAEATATLEKLQVGETVYGIEGGSDVYELTLSAADSEDLITYMQGTSDWVIDLSDVDIDELMEYAAIKVKASVTVESDVVNAECLLVKLAELEVNNLVAQAAFVSSDPVQLNAEAALFTIRIETEEDVETGNLHLILKGEPYAIKDSDITSGSTPDGYVLTSNGVGGCTWQVAGGANEPNIIVNLNCALSAFATENGAWRNDFITQQQEMPTWLAGIDEATLSSGVSDPLDTVIYAKTTDDVLIPIHVALNTEMGTILSLCLKISSYYYVIQMWYEANAETGYNLIVLWGTNDPSASNN